MMTDQKLKELITRAALRGSNKTSIYMALEKMVGLNPDAVDELLDSLPFRRRPWFINYLKFANTTISPSATKLSYPLTQIYVYEDFLRKSYCMELISLADEIAKRSSVSNPSGDVKHDEYRTSSTADIDYDENKIVPYINNKICKTLNLKESLGEAIQIQKYLPGEYYKEHNDYYHWFTPEHDIYTEWMGQRTWTFMVYLNDVHEGGETIFKHLNLKIKPKRGMAVFWNNLLPVGFPNYKTIHEAKPPISGNKYVITKWMRSWSLMD